jgi:hypothetical protein
LRMALRCSRVTAHADAVAPPRVQSKGHCCIEPKDVIATVQTSKVGSTIPMENHDKPGIRALLEGIWRGR